MGDKDPIKVSVLVPLYNKSGAIEKCLDSILAQTLGNIEIIVCDDSSTDDSLEKVAAYRYRDARIKLIKNEMNMGLVKTRIKLLEEAVGSYIYYLDADDYLVPSSLESLYFLAISHGANVVKGWAATKSLEGVSERLVECRHQKSGLVSFFNESSLWYHFGTLGLYLYKRDFIKNNRVLEQVDHFMAEDTAINAIALPLSDGIVLLNQLVFVIRRDIPSFSNIEKTPIDLIQQFGNYRLAIDSLKKVGGDVLDFFLQAQLARRYNELKRVTKAYSFTELAEPIAMLREMYADIDISRYVEGHYHIDLQPDCPITEEIVDLAILLRYAGTQEVYFYFHDKNHFLVSQTLRRIRDALSAVVRFAPVDARKREACGAVECSCAQCRIGKSRDYNAVMKSVEVASPVAPSILQEDVQCKFERLKNRIIRLRRSEFDGEDWQYFRQEVVDDIELFGRELNSRWLISIVDTFADWGSEQEQANAVLISTLVNYEKAVRTNEIVYRRTKTRAPIVDGVDYQASEKNSLLELWDGIEIAAGSANEDFFVNVLRRLARQLSKTPELRSVFKFLLLKMLGHESSTLALLDEYIVRFDLKSEVESMFGGYQITSHSQEMGLIGYLNRENRMLKEVARK